MWSTPHAHYRKEANNLGDEVVEQNLEVLPATASLSPKKTWYLFEVNKAMTQENRPLEPVEFQEKPVEIQYSRKFTITVEESMEYNPEWINEEKPGRCEHVGSWAWKH